MEGFWPIFFLAVVLKIPVAAMLFLVWWAIRAEPRTEEAPGGEDHGFRRWRPHPRKPRDPRRGPHLPDARPLPDCPPGGRFRVITAPAPVRVAAAHAEHRGSVEPAQR